MNREKELNENMENQIPENSDKQFWDDFSRELWFMFKKNEDLSDVETENQIFENIGSSDEIPKLEKTADLRENCLSFTRCAEIGQKNLTISSAEKLHLQNCRFCERRINKFGDLPKLVSIENTVEITEEENRKISWWSRIFTQKNMSFSRLPGRLVFAGLSTIIMVGAAIIILQMNFNRPNEETASITDPKINSPKPEISDPLPNTNAETEINRQFSDNSNDNSVTLPKRTPEKIPETKPTPKIREKKIPKDQPIELVFLSSNEREAVRDSIKAGRIQISNDLARLQEGEKFNPRGKVLQISPKNEATLESRPIFRWQNLENNEYRIIILDQELNKVAESEILGQNSWQIDKELPAGFYFWQVSVRKENASEFEITKVRMFFKIVGEAEKSRIERAKRSSKSNLVSAILYARAGLFAEAERDLNAELKKNPNSVKAQKMLAQVREWKMK